MAGYDQRRRLKAVVKPAAREEQIRIYYHTLFQAWGGQHWWPARTRFEVIVGAYLTQNTAWTNVERALRQMRTAGALNLRGIRSIALPELERMIRSSGYFRQKALRLKIFVFFLDERYGGSLDRMFAQPTVKLREELLALNGVGPETADSILLYAGQHPVFVVDAYTRRILERHAILAENAGYENVRLLCERALAGSAGVLASENAKLEAGLNAAHRPSAMSLTKRVPLAQVFNDMHGLIVGVGKHYCLKSRPKCDECPLQKFLPESKYPKGQALGRCVQRSRG
jgi:endonuclease III related protein